VAKSNCSGIIKHISYHSITHVYAFSDVRLKQGFEQLLLSCNSTKLIGTC